MHVETITCGGQSSLSVGGRAASVGSLLAACKATVKCIQLENKTYLLRDWSCHEFIRRRQHGYSTTKSCLGQHLLHERVKFVTPRIDHPPPARHNQVVLGTSPSWWRPATKTCSRFNRVWSVCEIMSAFLLKKFRSPCKLCVLLQWSIVLWQRQTIVFRLASIEELDGIDMFCFDKTNKLTQIIMILVSKFQKETSEPKLLSLAPLASEWIQNASPSKRQGSLDRNVSITRLSILLSESIVVACYHFGMRCLGSGQTTSRLVSPARCCRRACRLPPICPSIVSLRRPQSSIGSHRLLCT